MSGDDNAEGAPLGAAEDANESLGSLQARLAEHGRKLAEAAGDRVTGAVDEAGNALGEHTAGIGGMLGAAGENLGLGGHGAAPVETDLAPSDDGRLDLHENARLPWLESGDDDEYDGGVDTRRVAMFVVAGLALLAAIVGGIWWSTHRGSAADKVADGSLIKAEPGPYKTAPENPGGKTYEGTGDSSYAVSQGKNPAAHLGDATNAAAGGAVKTAEQAGQVAVAAAKSAGAAAAEAGNAAGHAATAAEHAAGAAEHAAAGGAVAGPSGGVGVQVGAYTSQAGAEAGWAKLEKQYAPLAGMHHRIVQGKADIGTVYRLQAVADSDGAANSLCSGMKGQGLACQVKR